MTKLTPFAFAVLIAMALSPLARAEPLAFKVRSLHESKPEGSALIKQSGDQVTLTATGRESYFGSDDGSFAYLTTDALSWRFTARVADIDADTPTPKYGIAVRTGLERWNRGLHVRYDGYEGNRAIQWMFRYGVAHGTHRGARRVIHSGVEKELDRKEDFWLRIERDYPTLTVSWSSDGENWQPVAEGYQMNLLPSEVHVGLMLTGGGNGKTPITAVYDNVSFEVLERDAQTDAPRPEMFADHAPLMAPWELHLATDTGEHIVSDGAASWFIIKPRDLPWEEVRAFMYTTSSKEVLIQNDDGSLGKLEFESGAGKLRIPLGIPEEKDGVYTLRPQPLWRIFEHHGIVRFGTAAKPEDTITGLKALAKKTGYPVDRIPWVNQGMSFAGGTTAKAARAFPERTIAASPTHLGMPGWESEEPAVLKTPHLYIIGSEDSGGKHMKQAMETVEPIRGKHARWAAAPLWWHYHSIGHTLSLSLPYFLDTVDLRLPDDADHSAGPIQLKDIPEEDGYLALADTIESNHPQVVHWSEATAAQRIGQTWWLPSERSARIWQASTSNWPKTVIHFPRFDDTGAWTGRTPASGHQHHQMKADQPFTIMASGPVGDDVSVEFYADMQPLKVLKTHGSKYIVTVEGLPVGLHNLYAITTIGDTREISRPQMIFFHDE